MENVSMSCYNGNEIEKYETEIKKASSANLAEAQIRVWDDFLSNL
jgi:hypothetical protein